MHIDQRPGGDQAGGNMEGKETRFGIANSVLWSAATTAASNGSVNSMHDSYTPLGGLVPLVPHAVRRGGVRRGRVRSLRHDRLRHHCGLCRGTDGREDAGVSRQENRAVRDEDGVTPDSDHAHHRAGIHGARGGHRRPARRRCSTRARMDSAKSCTPTPHRATTTAARLPV